MSFTDDDKEELLLSCRYGDIEDVQNFVSKYGAAALADIRDDNGNTILHMVCANGHIDLLNYLLPLLPPSFIGTKNASGSTALHWAALNSQLEVSKKLVQHPDGPGIDLIDIKNDSGRSPLGEAEMASWDEGAKWFVEVMRLDDDAGEEEVGDASQATPEDIEVQIEDADGQIAKMTISSSQKPASTRP